MSSSQKSLLNFIGIAVEGCGDHLGSSTEAGLTTTLPATILQGVGGVMVHLFCIRDLQFVLAQPLLMANGVLIFTSRKVAKSSRLFFP